MESLEALNGKQVVCQGYKFTYDPPEGKHFHNEFSHWMYTTYESKHKIFKKYNVTKQYSYCAGVYQ